ncbi:MAG: alpha-galactosidase [Ruminococcaceae bacterium]|nr:alpha-galactosidase [Oscillospiraceae bacterium]
MSIRFIKEKNTFVLNTVATTYAFDILGGKYLRHIYYGKKTANFEPAPLNTVSFSPYVHELGPSFSPDSTPNEISFFGSGDFRANSLRIKGADGTGVTDFSYSSYRIFNGRRDIHGIPFARADEKTRTLEITMLDDVTGCKLMLYYTVFEKYDMISRYMVIENCGKQSVKIEKCMSLELCIDRCDLDMVTLYGRHNAECSYQRVPLHHGVQSVMSRRGASSHQYNPFMAICSQKATEERGEVYGFNLMYSGSFLNEVEVDQLNTAKVLTGLGGECFGYTLESGECFSSPEAVMTYSAYGFGKMTRNFHNYIRDTIMPKAAFEPHPVVLNTWEACKFDIDAPKLVKFAEEANKLGFDMLVMDDGWFGERHNDRAALGDWYVSDRKFPNGLKAFVDEVHSKGVKFGIWIEPEMINPDSELYRAHPEWCLRVEGREPLRSRHQLVLDMSNNEVIEYLKGIFDKTFKDIDIEYFKWDMNRHMSNVGSSALPAHRQDEVSFRYMKGVYKLLDWLAERFPNTVIETCSGGGGRYDMAMMTYGIQIWTSDKTNPYNRTFIQSAAMTAYPAMTMSCHVSNPKGDMRSLDFRYKVALGGMLGYELNILEMTEEIKLEIAKQIKEYKLIEDVMRLGDYYMLTSPVKYPYSSYYYVNGDNGRIVLSVIETAACKAGRTKLLKIRRADRDATYSDIRTGKLYSGVELQNGISVSLTGKPDTAELFIFVRQ